MIEGKKIKQISKVFTRAVDGRVNSYIIERDHRVTRFKQYLDADVLPDGSVREHDIIQFYANPGGLRTVYAEDIVL